MCNLEILQVQHTTDEREVETIMRLRKAQQGKRHNSIMLFFNACKR